MRLFQISHPRFTGTAKIVYNHSGLLHQVDFSACQMTAEVIKAFKNVIPVTVTALEAGEGFTADAKIVEGSFEVTFDMFWSAYGQKINKLRCEKLWQGLNKAQQVFAWYGIAKYDEFLKGTGWRKKADPETYLRNRSWENEWK